MKEKYINEVVPALQKEFNYSNVMQVPRLEKISLNVGLGEAVQNVKLLDSVQAEMTAIAGQKAVITKAKKAIATYKLRAGMPIGCRVTLRRERMYEFLDRFISLALPRIRDFRGINPKSFDGRGNYSMGLDEQSAFPEIDPSRIENQQGMNITFVTTAETNDEGRELLRLFGMPFKED